MFLYSVEIVKLRKGGQNLDTWQAGKQKTWGACTADIEKLTKRNASDKTIESDARCLIPRR